MYLNVQRGDDREAGLQNADFLRVVGEDPDSEPLAVEQLDALLLIEDIKLDLALEQINGAPRLRAQLRKVIDDLCVFDEEVPFFLRFGNFAQLDEQPHVVLKREQVFLDAERRVTQSELHFFRCGVNA